MDLFKGEKYPVAEDLARTGMYLPSSSGLKEDEIRYICDVIKDGITWDISLKLKNYRQRCWRN